MEHLNPNELQQMRTDITNMKGKVDKMYYALMGSEIAKDGGLVGRIIHLEASVQRLDDRMEIAEKKSIKIEVYQKIMWGCVGGSVGLLFAYVISLLIK